MYIPSIYYPGYEKARALDQALADAYIEHTQVGDPLADAAIQSLDNLDQEESSRLIHMGMEGDEDGLKEAPDALKEFFGVLHSPPPGIFDPAKALAGSRVFYKYSDLFFIGLVLESLVTGLTEGLSKAFYLTGRTAGNLRRVKQNTRHVVEVTLPGGLERQGDGWKLTVRIRLIHARVRRLLLDSDDWDLGAEGVPLHMSHMALAATGFSAFNLHSVRKLGVRLTQEESDSFMHIWHYVAWLLGVPEELLFRTEDEAVHLREISHLCEPPPSEKAMEVAHGYISTVPELIGITKPASQKKLLNSLFRISRALIGHELADALNYPKQSVFGVLALARMQRRFQIIWSKVAPGVLPHVAENFIGMMQRSVYDDVGISYRMPDAVRDKQSSPW